MNPDKPFDADPSGSDMPTAEVQQGMLTRSRAAAGAAATAAAAATASNIPDPSAVSPPEQEDESPGPEPPTSQALLKALAALLLTERSGENGARRQPPLPRPEKPPAFSGDRKQLRHFQQRVELWLADYPSMTPNEQARRVGELLTGDASTVYLDLVRKGGATEITLPMLWDLLQSRFGTINEAFDARVRFDQAKQKNDVSAYAAYLLKVASTPGLEDILHSEAAMLHRFITGLHTDIKERLVSIEYSTFEEAVRAARRVEQLLQRHGPKHKRENLGAVRTHGEQSSQQGSSGGGSRAAGAQSRGRPSDTPSSAGSTDPVPGRDGQLHPDIECHRCHRRGHYKRQCPASSGSQAQVQSMPGNEQPGH